MGYDIVGITESQGRLLESRAPNIGFVAGLGAGKTRGLCAKAVQLGCENQGLPVTGFFATLSRWHVRNVLVPELTEYVGSVGNHFEWKMSHGLGVAHMGDGVRAEMLLVSGDRPDAVTGLNAPWGISDEAGLHRDAFLKKARPRVRFKRARRMQYVEGGTPEGIGTEFHEFCEGGKTTGLDMIRASTLDNPYLPADYVERTFSHFSEVERDAYIRGLFVAKAGRVYTFYKPEDHEVPCADPFDGELVICADFGSRTTPWGIGRIRENDDGEDELHLWGEVVGRGTTTWEQLENMKALILDRYEREYGEATTWDHIAQQIAVYCDATGQQRSYGRDGLSQSDVEIIVGSGLEIEVKRQNPPWRDRVASVQDKLRSRTLLIDREGCDYFARCLRQQGYNDNGRPQKSKDNATGKAGLDHGEEALGYLVYARWPVQAEHGGNHSSSRL